MTRWMKTLTAYWAERSPREQALVAGLAVVLAGLALWYGAIAPAIGYRADSQARYEAAAERFLRTQADLSRLDGAAVPVSAASANRPVRTVAGERAAAHGLAISRVLPDGDDRLNVWVETALADALTNWLTDLDRNHSIRVERATIERRGDRVVSAQLVLARGDN